MTIRAATPKDYDALGQVMFRAIREGASPYTAAQRAAWMPKANMGDAWAGRLAAAFVVVAERHSLPVGFMTIDATGYVDLAYLLPDARGQGLFDAMLAAVTDHAMELGLTEMRTHASLMAEPAFARLGFAVTHREVVARDGEGLRRAAMIKPLVR